jgi:hypothetical protein
MAAKRDIHWIWDVVVADRTVFGLMELVKTAKTMGANGIHLCNLSEMPTPPGAIEVRHIRHMPDAQLAKAWKAIDESREFCDKNGMQLTMDGGLQDVVLERI